MIPKKSTVKPVLFDFIRSKAKSYQRDGKTFCRMPETGREVNLTDFTFRYLDRATENQTLLRSAFSSTKLQPPAASKNGKKH